MARYRGSSIARCESRRLNFDRGEKADLYAEAGVLDYWVVDCTRKCIEVSRDPQLGQYKTIHLYRGEDLVRPLHFPDVVLWPADLFNRS